MFYLFFAFKGAMPIEIAASENAEFFRLRLVMRTANLRRNRRFVSSRFPNRIPFPHVSLLKLPTRFFSIHLPRFHRNLRRLNSVHTPRLAVHRISAASTAGNTQRANPHTAGKSARSGQIRGRKICGRKIRRHSGPGRQQIRPRPKDAVTKLWGPRNFASVPVLSLDGPRPALRGFPAASHR
jgi:hypothetical protein